MRPDGYDLIQRLKSAVAKGPTGKPLPTDQDVTTPEARLARARVMIAKVEEIAGENMPEVWDPQYKKKRSRSGLPFDAYKKLIAGLKKP